MAFVLDEDFEWFLEKFGQPQKIVLANEKIVEKYRSRLPERLLEYWKEYGFCGFLDGLIWLVNPDDFNESKNIWLKGTGIQDLDEYHVFARSGFGSLYLWGEKTGHSWRIDIKDNQIFFKKS
ncbi:MAG TPA: GAD-like domain-containing protein, partial [Cellvibrio sp.]|nr:GAD-like domain-containing protein [Cellvibrio sp.]